MESLILILRTPWDNRSHAKVCKNICYRYLKYCLDLNKKKVEESIGYDLFFNKEKNLEC